MHSPVVLSTFTLWYNRSPECFRLAKPKLSPSDTNSPFPFPWLPTTTISFPSLWLWLPWASHRGGVTECVSFCDWLASRNAVSSSPIHAAAGIRVSFLVEAECYSLGWMDPTFIHSSVDGLPLPFDGIPASLQIPVRLVLSPPRSRPVLSLSPYPQSESPSSPLSFSPSEILSLFLSQGFCTCFPSLHCLYRSSPNLWRASSSQYPSFISHVISAQRPDFSWNRCSILVTSSQATVSGFGHSGYCDLPLTNLFVLCGPLDGKLHVVGRYLTDSPLSPLAR